MAIVPTKGNLIAVKRSLKLAQVGFDLLDRKRSILIREMMLLIEKVRELNSKISNTFAEAYQALQYANITLGVVDEIAQAVPIDNGISITYKSVMGVEIPQVYLQPHAVELVYGFSQSNSYFDNAYILFQEVKTLTALLAEVENSVYRLANEIQKTQKRANALENIVIPDYQSSAKFISEYLEEKEREEFSRMKFIKGRKEKLNG